MNEKIVKIVKIMENAKNSKKFSGKRKAVIASMTGDAVSALRITAVT